MSRYHTAFALCKQQKRMAFIPFAVAGDPDIATSEAILKAYIDNGADILEIGYPFSDPVADGPVNQRAAQRAIEAGLTPTTFFSLIEKIRKYSDIPIGLLLYGNTVHHIGYDVFCKRASKAGVDSLLVADMPPEESKVLAAAMSSNGLGMVHIVSELTPTPRMQEICDSIDSFVYVVSRLGPTGTSAGINDSIKQTLARLHHVTNHPLCVGFGISRPSQIVSLTHAGADGAIVGSALVSIIEENLSSVSTMLAQLGDAVSGFSRATRTR